MQALLAPGLLFVPSQEAGVRCESRPERTRFYPYEPIRVVTTLTNRGGATSKGEWIGEESTLEGRRTDDSGPGRWIVCSATIGCCVPPRRGGLEPGESIVFQDLLNFGYQSRGPIEEEHALTTPGRYDLNGGRASTLACRSRSRSDRWSRKRGARHKARRAESGCGVVMPVPLVIDLASIDPYHWIQPFRKTHTKPLWPLPLLAIFSCAPGLDWKARREQEIQYHYETIKLKDAEIALL